MTAADSFTYRFDSITPAPDLAPDLEPEVAPDDYADDDCTEDEETDAITLHDLHEEVVANATETRRATRRMLEVFKNFGSVLDALSATASDTHKAVRSLPSLVNRQADGGELPREWALALVELADRIERVNSGFSRPPATRSSWWPGARKSLAAWRETWAMQADALGILRGHLNVLLQRASLKRLDVLGKPFDPNTMTALDSAVDPNLPDHTVLAEMLPGWQHSAGQLLRPAQVRVSRLAAR
ncbi:MAG: nucleotide exchange factor GrpE [Verrucomicrobiota bacterium]